MPKFLKQALILGAVAAPLGSQAEASVIIFNNAGSFESAVSGSQTFTFDGLASPGVPSSAGFQVFPTGLTINGATFVGVNSPLFVIDPAASLFPAYEGFGSGSFITAAGGTGAHSLSQIAVRLPSHVSAVGFDLGTFGQRGEPVTVSFLSQSFTFGTSPEFAQPTFVGFTSDRPLGTILLSARAGANARLNLDNFMIGPAASAVPEPATWAFMIVGFGAVGASIRSARRKRLGAASA